MGARGQARGPNWSNKEVQILIRLMDKPAKEVQAALKFAGYERTVSAIDGKLIRLLKEREGNKYRPIRRSESLLNQLRTPGGVRKGRGEGRWAR